MTPVNNPAIQPVAKAVLAEKSERLINMKRLNLGIVGALVVLAGCSDGALTSGLQDETTGTEVFASKGATTSSFGNPLGEPSECSGNYRSRSYELLAGQKKSAGFVNVSTDGNFLYVTYDTNETADLKEVHVNVYTKATDVPTKRPAPGQAPYKAQNLFLDSYTVSIPLSDFNLQGADLCGFTFYVIAHAALTVDETGSEANAGETAYSGGNNNLGKGAWFYISEYTVGCDCTAACISEGDLIAGQYSDIGSVVISDDAENIYVTYTTEGDWLLDQVHVYVYSDVSQLPANRPAPGQAPYKAENLGVQEFVVVIAKADLARSCPVIVVPHASVYSISGGSETAYGGILGETDINVGGRGAWYYYQEFACCS